MKFLNQKEAAQVDDEFFSTLGYTLDQLMELAGLSVAQTAYREFPPSTTATTTVAVICGPGSLPRSPPFLFVPRKPMSPITQPNQPNHTDNGGDGLVCARHLLYYGYRPVVVYPKPNTRTPFLARLVQQLAAHGIAVEAALPAGLLDTCAFVVDAIFGYSFRPPVRGVFADIIAAVNASAKPVLAVDVPSGWDVEAGPLPDTVAVVHCAVCVSLSAPKLCVARALPAGCRHYLGGRFVPPCLAQKMGLDLPVFPGADMVVLLQ